MSLWSAFALPSLTTILIVADFIARGRILTLRERQVLIAALALATIVFYPMAIGIVHVDAYRFGFTPWAPAVLAAIGVVIALRFPRIAVALLVMLVLFDLHALPSLNLFDYVLDPIGGIFAIVWTAVTFTWRHRSRTA